jgi:hypothetical protein
MTKRQKFLLQLVPQLLIAMAIAWLVVIVCSLLGVMRLGASWIYLPGTVGMALFMYHWSCTMRERYVRESPMPQFLRRKLRETYPHLTMKDCDLVEHGFRQFFLACSRSKRQFVAMPSKAVDAMWHEFILHTKAYQQWCELALGHFLHHTPAEALGRQARGNDGLRRAWYWTCKDEAINPKKPSRLPLLFALDKKLGIANGFVYQPNCKDIQSKNVAGGQNGEVHCGTSFSDHSYSGGSGNFGGVESAGSGSSGDVSSNSDGDGGSGGCGGGGD